MMEYKAYTGQITDVDEKHGIFHGDVVGINDVITFEGINLEELVQAFHDSVDDYIAFCEERAEPPEKPLSGKFLLRISPDLHQQASIVAKKAGESLNAWVASAIKAQLAAEKAAKSHSTKQIASLDLTTLLSLLEARRPTIFPGRPYPAPFETDPLESVILRLLREKLEDPMAKKQRGKEDS